MKFPTARTWGTAALGLLALVLSARLLPAQSTGQEHGVMEALSGDEDFDLTQLSLDDLMSLEIEVTSASRSAQSVSEVPAAITVLTQTDIRRSGARNLPELLRMVPGVQVARIDSNRWAVSTRGFNGQFSDKMLIQIDGRSLYTPLFSGVFWDQQGVVLEDIERIEVIRGPGAAMWGANAVNGVVNVITKSAAHTQGSYLRLGTGTEERASGLVRQGGRFASGGAWRVYATGFSRDELLDQDGGPGQDSWEQLRGGFRMDWGADPDEGLTLQGEAFTGRSEQITELASPNAPYLETTQGSSELSGGHLLGRWRHRTESGSQLALQLYYDRNSRDSDVYGAQRDVVDVDLQQHLELTPAQELIWGAGYRHQESVTTRESFFFKMNPDHRVDDIFSAFVQHQVDFADDRWRFVWGAKLEENDSTGFEFQPNARVLWRLDSEQSLWASLARAVRTPTNFEENGELVAQVIPGTPDVWATRIGNGDVISEELLAHELGYRSRLTADLSLDLATFYNRYEHLVTSEPGAPFFNGTALVAPFYLDNRSQGETWGGELELEWRARADTKVYCGYTYMEVDIDGSDSADPLVKAPEGNHPRHEVHARVYHDLTEHWDLDGALYWVDALSGDGVPSYLRVDGRVEWRPRVGTRIELGLRGLFHDEEREFEDGVLGPAGRVETAVFLLAAWSF